MDIFPATNPGIPQGHEGLGLRALRPCADGRSSLLSPSFTPSVFAEQIHDAVAIYPRGGSKVSYSSMKPLADQGIPPAQYTIGILYEVGSGVRQDYAEAARWCRKAAEHGDRFAQTSLGVLYHKGQGVPGDYVEAANWYRMAAEQGDTFAQINLGVLCAKGQGVRQDYVLAHMWFDLLSSAEVTLPDLREKAAKNRGIAPSKMTSAQIAEAQKLAREWIPKMER